MSRMPPVPHQAKDRAFMPCRGGVTRPSLTRRTLLLGALAFGARPVRAATPSRIVVLGGDLAEIAFALGAGARVVGTDDTAQYPPEAAALPKVGYMRRFGAEGVLSLAPDLVLAHAAAGPDTALDQLRAAGLRVETAPAADGWAGVPPKIAFVGAMLGLEAEAAALIAHLEAEMASVGATPSPVPRRGPVCCS